MAITNAFPSLARIHRQRLTQLSESEFQALAERVAAAVLQNATATASVSPISTKAERRLGRGLNRAGRITPPLVGGRIVI